MSGSAFTWSGADGGSWNASGNWVQGTTPAVQAPGSLDLAQFVSFSGTVTGSVGSDILDIGPNSTLTLGGSGFFSNITVGQDLAFNTGAATLAIGSGDVVSATLLNVGSVGGGGGTLVADGTFTTTGGINLGSPGFAATIEVGSGGDVTDSANDLTMGNGGLLSVAQSGELVLGSSGVSGAFAINSGHVFSGIGTIAANVVDNGSLATANFGNAPTVLAITGNVTGAGTLSAVQELDIGGSIGSGIDVSLFGNGGSNAGLLRLTQPTNDAGTLVTMSTNSTIALTGLNFDNAVWTPGSLTVTGASATLTLATAGDHSHQLFVAQPDAVSGTDIIVLACFAAGTRIHTTNGPVAVEDLRPGDPIEARFGGVLPAVWIGRRRVYCRRHPRPVEVWPIRVRAGAFGDGVPTRDLLLSPDHAVFVDDVMIPIKHLINGSTIAQEPCDEVSYFHVELARHDVVLAEGLATESYLDTGNRWNFKNGGGPMLLHPDFAFRCWDAMGCARLIVTGPILAAVRARLQRRAAGRVLAAHRR
jgi:collagen type I/II/III/V/XI/XXIV/XXVII alpha